MHDGAPCHNCCTVSEFMDAHGIETLPWPGNSPDMNPIKNLWSVLRSKMHKKTITNKRQLIEELISAWMHEDRMLRDACKELVHSMPARVAALNNAKGLFTKYKFGQHCTYSELDNEFQKCGHLKFFKMAAGRHLGFDRIGNGAV